MQKHQAGNIRWSGEERACASEILHGYSFQDNVSNIPASSQPVKERLQVQPPEIQDSKGTWKYSQIKY